MRVEDLPLPFGPSPLNICAKATRVEAPHASCGSAACELMMTPIALPRTPFPVIQSALTERPDRA
jgi:hypothetical protein